MRILVSGATGFVGKRLSKALALEGHSLVVLTRSPEKAKQSLALPIEALQWSPDTAIDPTSLKGIEAVIHLAGEGVAEKRWSPEQKKKIYDSRINGTKQLMTALAKMPGEKPKAFISASAIGFYGNRGEETLTESSKRGEGFLSDVCVDWEKEVFASQPFTMRRVAIRVSLVLGSDGGALMKMLPPFKMGLGGNLGDGKHWMSWIHVDDLVKLFVHALKTPTMEGVFNGSTETPVTNSEFTKTLGEVLHRPTILPAPKFALKLALGEMSDILLASQKVVPERTKQSGFKYEYQDLKTALEAICKKKSPDGELILEREQWIPEPLEKTFAFFADEKNLERITPPWLNFQVVGKTTKQIERGTFIDYRLRIHGIPMKWRSHIAEWENNKYFVDTQVKGPYGLWHHTHSFYSLGSGTLVVDRIRYRVPGGALGNCLAGWFVKRDLEKIFGFRKSTIESLFKEIV